MTARRAADAFGLGPVPYFSFGLARALALAGVKTVDGRDWYRIGAAGIVASQQADGSWYLGPEEQADVLETCWHLLFLTRATVPATAG